MKQYIKHLAISLSVVLFFIISSVAIAERCITPGEIIQLQKKVDKSYSPKETKKFSEIIAKARKYAENNYVENAAIVLDVDETLLDNRKYYALYDYYNDRDWDKWIQSEDAIPHEETKDLVLWAKDLGYKIILITGRLESQREATENNLKRFDIPFDQLHMRPDNMDISQMSDYKLNIRKKLTEKGLNIIVNIGDQKSDIRGGFGKGFKLPNSIYSIP
jgi:predicted secreted acid phosphatase